MIQLNDFRRQWANTRQETLAAVEAVGDSGWYILGSEVHEFESALAVTWGVRHAVGVASGLDALEIGLRVLGCKPGDRVLTTPVTAFATTLAIARIGAVPVFVDVDEFGLLDLDRCDEVLQRRPEIRYALPVHLYGHSLDLGRLRALRERHGLRIVEDCAQSILAEHNGCPAGTAGQVAATSFYPTKNLGAIGDGGALLADDQELIQRARRLRDYGQSAKYRHDEVGYNSRLDELQAAILRRVHLVRLPEWTGQRRRIAAAYSEGIRNPAIDVPGAPRGSHSCWHLFPVLVSPERKEAFRRHLHEQGVATAEHYPLTTMEQDAMRHIPHEVEGSCDVALRLCRSEVSLPIHPYLTEDEVRQVAAACNGWKG